MKLTSAQRRKLESLTDEWREQDHDWKAGDLFHRLADRGLCEMKLAPPPGKRCDVRNGPGVSVRDSWWTRRTADGRKAIGLPGDLAGSLAMSAD